METDPKVTSATEVEPAQKDEASTDAEVEGAKEEGTKAGDSPPVAEVEPAPKETSKPVEGEPVAEKRMPDRARTPD